MSVMSVSVVTVYSTHTHTYTHTYIQTRRYGRGKSSGAACRSRCTKHSTCAVWRQTRSLPTPTSTASVATPSFYVQQPVHTAKTKAPTGSPRCAPCLHTPTRCVLYMHEYAKSRMYLCICPRTYTHKNASLCVPQRMYAFERAGGSCHGHLN
jgi:hypothetical protein